jgi:hypothetical protein
MLLRTNQAAPIISPSPMKKGHFDSFGSEKSRIGLGCKTIRLERQERQDKQDLQNARARVVILSAWFRHLLDG